MKIYKKCTAKLFSFLVIDATLASDNLLGRIYKLVTTIDDKI